MKDEILFSQSNPIYQSFVTGTPQYSFLIVSFGIIICSYIIIAVLAITPALQIKRKMEYNFYQYPVLISYIIIASVVAVLAICYVSTFEDKLYSLSHRDAETRAKIIRQIADGRIHAPIRNAIRVSEIKKGAHDTTPTLSNKIIIITKEDNDGYYALIEDNHGDLWKMPVIALINSQTIKAYEIENYRNKH